MSVAQEALAAVLGEDEDVDFDGDDEVEVVEVVEVDGLEEGDGEEVDDESLLFLPPDRLSVR